MSVRLSLLAILDQGPCYGYQLRAEFDRRTGSTWPLNVGQIYNTLDRLERDGLVAKGDTDDQGHVYYEITEEGRGEVQSWLATPVIRADATRDELASKLALAATLPGVDATRLVQTQRDASVAALESLQLARGTERASVDDAEDGESLARQLVADALVFRAEAEVRWLEHVQARLSHRASPALQLSLSADRPRRGRPPKASTSAASAG